jgi:hypothetical protein
MVSLTKPGGLVLIAVVAALVSGCATLHVNRDGT